MVFEERRMPNGDEICLANEEYYKFEKCLKNSGDLLIMEVQFQNLSHAVLDHLFHYDFARTQHK